MVAHVFQINLSFAQITPNFSADTTRGCDFLSNVRFTDLSTGSISSWNWNFGNGSFSQLQNPVANYNSPGRYNVTLVVSDGTRTDSITKIQYIKVFNEPVSDYSFSPDSGCAPLSVNFSNNVSLGDTAIQSYIWDFGDGSPPENGANPTHTYLNSGSYPTSLQVIDRNGCSDVKSKTNVTVLSTLKAEFITQASPVSCNNTHQVSFVNTSQGTILSYFWDFGDGQTSTLANPTHTYNGFGQYDVTLIANSIDCSDTLFLENYVRLEITDAIFNLPKKFFCVGDSITFSNNSLGSNNFSWDFGDGTFSTNEEPIKVYQDSGFFIIRLTASLSSNCIDSITDTIYVQKVIADFSFSPNTVCKRTDTFKYVNQSINAETLIWGFALPDLEYRRRTTLSTVDTVRLFDSQFYPYTNGDFLDSLTAISKEGCVGRTLSNSFRNVTILDFLINVIESDSAPKVVNPNTFGSCLPLYADFKTSPPLSPSVNTFHWDFGNGDTSDLQFPPTVTYLDTNRYRVTLRVKNSAGCDVTDSVFIRAGVPQNPSLIFSEDSVCAQNNELIILTSSSTDDNQIQKYFFKVNYPYINDSIEIERNRKDAIIVNQLDTGYVNATLTISSFGCDTTVTVDSAYYSMGPKMNFWLNVAEDSGCFKRKEFFGSFVKGANRFEWDFGDGSPLNTTDTFLTHIFPAFNTSYTVSLTAYNDSNRCDSVRLSTIVEFLDFSNTSIVTNKRNFCLGENLNLSVQTTLPIPSFEWTLSSHPEEKTDQVVNYPLNSIGPNYITLVMKDKMGCDTTFRDTVYVFKPQVNFDTTLISKCFPWEIRFNDLTNSDTTLTQWRWDFGNGTSSNRQNPIRRFLQPDTLDVSLTVQDILGCTATDTLKNFIRIEKKEVDFESQNTAICLGDNVTFRNLFLYPGLQYEWDFGDNTTINSNNEFINYQYSQRGTYTVTLSGFDVENCRFQMIKTGYVKVEEVSKVDFNADTTQSECFPLAVSFTDLSEGDINQWFWKFGNGASSSLQDPFHNYVLPGDFDVSLRVETQNGCTDSLMKPDYIQTEGPVATILIDKDSVCVNEVVNFSFTATESLQSFTWNFGDGNTSTDNPTSHIYSRIGNIQPTLVITNSAGTCTVTFDDQLFVFAVKADFINSVDSGCAPLTVNFLKRSTGDDNFLWRFGDGNTSNISNPSYTYNTGGTYIVNHEVTSLNGCFDTARTVIEVYEKPAITLSENLLICEGDTVLLTASGGDRYLWLPNFNLSNNTIGNVLAYPNSSVIYEVQAITDFGCSDTALIEVLVQKAPKPEELPDSVELIIGESYDLDVFTGDEFSYQWSPKIELNCSECPRPKVQPLKDRNYIITINDTAGCFNYQDSVYFRILEKFSLDVPSAFSPNNDGVNDIIFVKGWGLKELLSFKIYNRFGELIFESNDFEIGWDGTYNGKTQNVETYVYTVEALSFGGKVLTKKGNINLIK